MKKILILVTTLVASIAFSAQKNPQIRTCHNLDGELVVANSHNDQIGFCKFNKALIGAMDLASFINNETIPQSINAYIKNQTECLGPGQIETFILVGGNDSMQVCAYGDGSYIELGTLIKGFESADNSKLNEALGL